MNREFTLQLAVNLFGECKTPFACGQMCHCGESVLNHPSAFDVSHTPVPMFCEACELRMSQKIVRSS